MIAWILTAGLVLQVGAFVLVVGKLVGVSVLNSLDMQSLSLVVVSVSTMAILVSLGLLLFYFGIGTTGEIQTLRSQINLLTEGLKTSSKNLDGWDTILKSRQKELMGRLDSLIIEVPDRLSSALGQLEHQLQQNGFALLWRTLPYSEHFRLFDRNLKALYFDAITSGDWSRLNAAVRKLRRIDG